MLWLHVYGCSIGSLRVLRPRDRNIPYAFRKVHMRAPYRSLWISYGLGNTRTIMHVGTVRARVDVIYGLGNSGTKS